MENSSQIVTIFGPKKECTDEKSTKNPFFEEFPKSDIFSEEWPSIDLKMNKKPEKKFKKYNLERLAKTLHLVYKFINSIRSSSGLKKINILNSFHFNLMNDLSYFPSKISFISEKLTLSEKLKRFPVKLKFLSTFKKYLISKKPSIKFVIDPTKKFKLFWDIFILFMIIINFFIIILDFGFEINFINEYVPLMNFLNKISFILNFIINLNTAFYKTEKICFDKFEIIKKYIKKFKFIQDFLNIIISFNLFAVRSWIDLLFIYQIKNIFKIIKRIRLHLYADSSMNNYINLLKLLLNIFIVAHIFACIWFFIGRESDVYIFFIIIIIKYN